MKNARKNISLLIAIIFCISCISFPVFSADNIEDEEYAVYVGGVGMNSGDFLAVDSEETQKVIPENVGYAHFDGVFLHLVNYSYTGEGYLCKEAIDKYITHLYPTVIYSQFTLKIFCVGQNSLIGKSTSGMTRGIYSDKDINLYGDGKLYVKAKRAVYSVGQVNINDTYLDVYSDYFYGVYSNQSSVTFSRATLKLRGSAGIHTYTLGKNVAFYGSAVDISVADNAISSGGDIIIDDSNVTAVSDNPDFYDQYPAFSVNGDVKYDTLTAQGSKNASGSDPVIFNKDDVSDYHWVNFSRNKKLKYIDVVDILKPETDCYPDYEGNTDSAYTKILDIKWFHVVGDEETEFSKHVFRKDEKYRLKVTVIADSMYEFDDINTSAYIGNDLVQNYCLNNNLKKRVLVIDYIAHYNPEDFAVTIGNVTLKEGEYLKKGASSVTTTKPDDCYASYENGVLVLNNFVDKNADIVFKEGYISVLLCGESTVSSISDSYETDKENHDVVFWGDGTLDIIGSNSSLSRRSNVNLSGRLYMTDGTVNIDADITYCIDANGVWLTGGELYCYTAQGGVFANACEIYIYGGMFHAFDGGTWGKFINDEVIIKNGVVYVASDAKNSFESAAEWNGKTPLNDYNAVWILLDRVVNEPDILVGDVNNDGEVDSSDATMMLKYDAGMIDLADEQTAAGDVNADDELDSGDATMVLKFDAGMIDEL